MSTVHASAALVGERGVLIRGASGSGKSSLLLGLLAGAPESTWLVADDRVVLTATHGRLVASVPVKLAGAMEIRGQGIVRRSHVSPVRIHLVVDLKPADECDRMPEPEEEQTSIEGIDLPRLDLPIGIADGALRVRAALDRQAPGNSGFRL
jgi:serine kinase of HPr protein (carbohydrate metabolism regulator)